MGKSWRAKAAIMLKSIPNILLIEKYNLAKHHQHARELSADIMCKSTGKDIFAAPKTCLIHDGD